MKFIKKQVSSSAARGMVVDYVEAPKFRKVATVLPKSFQAGIWKRLSSLYVLVGMLVVKSTDAQELDQSV